MKATIDVEVEIPGNTIIFDLGAERLVCNLCQKHKKCNIYPGADHDEPDLPSRLLAFAQEHGKCVYKQSV